MNIVDVTTDLLNKRPVKLTLAQIHRDTGLPVQFLTRLGNKKVKIPHANDVQILYEYLTGEKLLSKKGGRGK